MVIIEGIALLWLLVGFGCAGAILAGCLPNIFNLCQVACKTSFDLFFVLFFVILALLLAVLTGPIWVYVLLSDPAKLDDDEVLSA